MPDHGEEVGEHGVGEAGGVEGVEVVAVESFVKASEELAGGRAGEVQGGAGEGQVGDVQTLDLEAQGED